jgi:ADP-ribosylglycohydrolase
VPTSLDAAEGAVLGALCGDAAGAVLELLGRPITADDAAHALTMPGGGTWEVAPGQVTDDGELTMSLLRALADAARTGTSPRENAASAYARWVASDPFDIGATTAASLGCLRHERWAVRAAEAGLAAAMTEAARERCMGSKANGALMRATPLGVWGARREDDGWIDDVVRAATDDARLSHPNASCVDATVAYAIAIAALVRFPGDAARAIDAAAPWTHTNACDEVKGWIDDALAGVCVAYEPQIGFVRIAFTHAFRHLAEGTRWEDAIRETLLGGGDTDTNACIVGGLVGARCGAGALPRAMVDAVLDADLARGENPRPDELHPRSARAREEPPPSCWLDAPRSNIMGSSWRESRRSGRPPGSARPGRDRRRRPPSARRASTEGPPRRSSARPAAASTIGRDRPTSASETSGAASSTRRATCSPRSDGPTRRSSPSCRAPA